MMYSKKILNRFQKPKFAGELKDADGVGQVGNMKCGDIMKVFIKVEKKGDKEYIKDIKFLTYGCVAAIASSDYLCQIAKGKTLEDAKKTLGIINGELDKALKESNYFNERKQFIEKYNLVRY